MINKSAPAKAAPAKAAPDGNGPATEETIRVQGLEAPAEIVVDPWGIPHLRAGGMADLWFVQGFNAARDRLWQIDLWRKRGLGRLAEAFGPGYLAQDRAARLFLFRGDMAEEWASYAPDARAICERFAAGINAFVALTEREPDRLPPEFGLTGTRPAPWVAADVVRIRSHGLTRNALSEVLRARVLAELGPDAEALRKVVTPPRAVSPAPGLDLDGIPLALLKTFKLAMAPVSLAPARLAATLDEADAWSKVDDLGDVVRDVEWHGSNNWVVHGSRTETGRPILANDPHRTHSVPPGRYLVQLTAPGFDAVGAGEANAPGITLGHNGTAAFGMTIFGADQEDVYVYDTHPDDPGQYRYGDGWERMRVVTETVSVRGAPEQSIALKFTRHGPVLFEEPGRHRAYALRSVWGEAGAAPYLACLSGMRATTLDEFRAAMRRWVAPSLNQVYADVGGTAAWLPVGFMPRRPNWDGLLPVPGDGSHEWAGRIDQDTLPCVVDPAKGYFATANEMNLPADWDHDRNGVGFDWAERARSARLHEVLDGQARHSVAQSCALQTDVVSLPARRLSALLARCAFANAAERARLLLCGWDGALPGDSAPAALFELWWSRHLKPALFNRAAGGKAARALLAPGDSDGLLAALETPAAWLSGTARDGLLADTLAAAWADGVARLGADPAGWRWDALHHGYFAHPLTEAANGRGPRLDVGPFPMGGSGLTPMHTGYRGDFRIIHGASVRMVIDVGDWDRSVCINAPGQSGDPRSPHYADLAPLWAKGGYVPMLYGRAAVDAAARHRIRLEPLS